MQTLAIAVLAARLQAAAYPHCSCMHGAAPGERRACTKKKTQHVQHAKKGCWKAADGRTEPHVEWGVALDRSNAAGRDASKRGRRRRRRPRTTTNNSAPVKQLHAVLTADR